MMREQSDSIVADFKALRLHGMASTWADLVEQNNGELQGSRWLIEQMLRAETTERATRSVGHQMSSAKFPVHRGTWQASTSRPRRWTASW